MKLKIMFMLNGGRRLKALFGFLYTNPRKGVEDAFTRTFRNSI